MPDRVPTMVAGRCNQTACRARKETSLRKDSLVLYKTRPARVERVGKKLQIELEAGETLQVRLKDVVLLHPGPLHSLDDLQPQSGEVETAWELLAGTTTTLAELAELAYGDFTPASAWEAWQLVELRKEIVEETTSLLRQA